MKKQFKNNIIKTFLVFIFTCSIMFAQPDTYYSNQWYLQKIKIPLAWEHTTGTSSIIIGVLDSGIPLDDNGNLSHPELDASRVILGDNYSSSSNGLKDLRGHGTHMAGIIGAKTNNGIGIAGICFSSKLFISKIIDDNGGIEDAVKVSGAVKDAISNGCKIINLSFSGTSDPGNEYKRMIEYARANNVLIVASAGNTAGSNNSVRYPAKYTKDYDNVIAVSATDENDNFAFNYPDISGSCYGPEVTVPAPGVNIYSTIPDYYSINFHSSKNYDFSSGTSMATPIVAAVAGLVWSKFPHYTAAQVKQRIISTADDLCTSGHDNYFGYGRVNAHKAVNTVYVPGDYPTLHIALVAAHPDDDIVITNGTYTENSSVTITAGVTLQIEPGTVVNFNENLIINGSLIAKGTLNLNSGLIVNGSLKTNGATLKFGNRTGLEINGSANFQSTKFTGNYPGSWNGINIYSGVGSSLTIPIGFNNCEISNGEYGINVNNTSRVSIVATKIHHINRYNNLQIGGCATNFVNYSSSNIILNNVFYWNDWDIRGDTTSTPEAGSYIGYNSFRDPCYYQFFSSNPSTLYARGNYWGIGPINSGNIDIADAFPYDINTSMSLEDDHKAEVESKLFLRKTAVKNDEPINEKIPGIEELDKAMKLLFTEKYEEALPEMHKLAHEYKDGYVGKRALVHIEHILGETDKAEEILPMLEKYSNGKSKVAQFAYYRTGYQYLYQREYDKAIAIMKGTEFSEEDAYLRQIRLYDLGAIHHNFLDKKAESYDYFSELVNTYPDCPLADVSEVFYKVNKYNYEKPITKDITTITDTKLFANYPNPFNPSTIIKYQLPKASIVSLISYI